MCSVSFSHHSPQSLKKNLKQKMYVDLFILVYISKSKFSSGFGKEICHLSIHIVMFHYYLIEV